MQPTAISLEQRNNASHLPAAGCSELSAAGSCTEQHDGAAQNHKCAWCAQLPSYLQPCKQQLQWCITHEMRDSSGASAPCAKPMQFFGSSPSKPRSSQPSSLQPARQAAGKQAQWAGGACARAATDACPLPARSSRTGACAGARYGSRRSNGTTLITPLDNSCVPCSQCNDAALRGAGDPRPLAHRRARIPPADVVLSGKLRPVGDGRRLGKKRGNCRRREGGSTLVGGVAHTAVRAQSQAVCTVACSSSRRCFAPSASEAGGKSAVQAGSWRPTQEVDAMRVPQVCTDDQAGRRQG